MRNRQTADIHPPAHQKFYKRLWFRVIVDVVGIYILWCTGLYFLQGRILFPVHAAPKARQSEPAHPNATVFKLDIKGGGEVQAWFIPAESAGAENPVPVVMFFHGNAEIIEQQQRIVRGYRRLGFSVFLPEYRGYGRSAGKPSQKAILSDNVRFYEELLKRDDVDPSRIVFHGRSLGGGLAADLATRHQPAALILESTFASAAGMAYRYAAPSFLVTNPLRTDRVISDVDIPILIFHGTHDRIIPVSHGRKLRDLAGGVTYVEYDCGHNDFPGSGNDEIYWQEIKDFLGSCNLIARSS